MVMTLTKKQCNVLLKWNLRATMLDGVLFMQDQCLGIIY